MINNIATYVIENKQTDQLLKGGLFYKTAADFAFVVIDYFSKVFSCPSDNFVRQHNITFHDHIPNFREVTTGYKTFIGNYTNNDEKFRVVVTVGKVAIAEPTLLVGVMNKTDKVHREPCRLAILINPTLEQGCRMFDELTEDLSDNLDFKKGANYVRKSLEKPGVTIHTPIKKNTATTPFSIYLVK